MITWLYKLYYNLPWTPRLEVALGEVSHRLQVNSYTITIDILRPKNCTVKLRLGKDQLALIELEKAISAFDPSDKEEANLIATSFIPANKDLNFSVEMYPGNCKKPIRHTSIQVAELKPDKVNQPYIFDIDGILDRSAFESQVVSGWCFAVNPLKVNKIQARLDDTQLDTEFHLSREDTKDTYPEQPDAAKCGFECDLPPGKEDGTFTIECQVGKSPWIEFYQTSLQTIPRITDKPPAKKAARIEATESNCIYNVETIFIDAQTQLKTKLVGWVFLKDETQIMEVRICTRNKIYKSRYGLQRGDVFQEFPEQTNSIYSGFESHFKDIPGNPTLQFQYRTEGRRWTTFDQRKPSQIQPTLVSEQEISALKSGVICNVEHAQIGRRFGHQFLIIGWCFRVDGKPVTDVRIKCGKRVFKGESGIKRLDVHNDNKDSFENCMYPGFEIPLDDIPRKSTLRFEYKTPRQRWKHFANEDFSRFPVSHYASKTEEKANYQKWLKKHESILNLSETEADNINLSLDERPTISILMPVYNTPKEYLKKAIDSVLHQYYPNWELCIADDASDDSQVWETLQEYASRDERIKIVRRDENGHICRASNSALELATGKWCTFLDHDDAFTRDALLRVVTYINRNPELALLYSDEDKMDSKDHRHDPYFKPDWNPELLEGQNFLCHLTVTKTELIRNVDGFEPGLEGSQDWDLVLKITENLVDSQIAHIPYVLYHWRAIKGSTALALAEKEYIKESSFKTLHGHCKRTNSNTKIIPIAHGHWRLKHEVPEPIPMVSIIIPTRDQIDTLKNCIKSIQDSTTYYNYEFLIVDNQSTELETIKYFEEIRSDNTRVISYPHKFNFSAINNFATEHARGDLLAFVNNDITIINGDWLEEMVSHAWKDHVGAVGAKLYFPEDCVQHAGIILGINGVAGHCFKYAARGEPGQRNRLNLIQRMSSVTAACLLVRKSVFQQVGGFEEENLGVTFNDIDLCLRIREAGYVNIWTPHAQLYHHESLSRGDDNDQNKKARADGEIEFMRRKWGEKLHTDPTYNPNLTLEYEDFSLAWPPRLAIDES